MMISSLLLPELGTHYGRPGGIVGDTIMHFAFGALFRERRPQPLALVA
jgi:hypothetical protein